MDAAPRPVAGVGGYVLAGGRSSRMGRDKALLELGGAPLVQHAVRKLGRVCADVHILSGLLELEQFAPLVRDRQVGCGPMGGLDAAFAHSQHEWNLFMPVDMPFFPLALLFAWTAGVVARSGAGGFNGVEFYTVDGTPQPLLCLLHRAVAPYISGAMERGDYKIFPTLEWAGRDLAERHGAPVQQFFRNHVWAGAKTIFEDTGEQVTAWGQLTEAQRAAEGLWFANLNTPEEFIEAERHLEALDTR